MTRWPCTTSAAARSTPPCCASAPVGIDILGSPEGIERLGGVDFDDAILAHINFSSGGALSELDLSNPQTGIALARLRQDCIAAKEALSIDTEASIPVFLPNRHFDVRLTRGEFEDMIRAQIESTIGALTRTLRSARVEPTDLSAVLLVGGSSRIPLVAQMITAALNRPTLVDAHPKYAVALGAATVGAELGAPDARVDGGARAVGPARAHGGAGRVRAVRTASRGRTAAPGRAGRRGPRRRARPGRRLRGRLDRWPRARGRIRDVTVRVRRHARRARATRDREPSRRAAVPRPPPAPVQRRGAGERQRRMVPARLGHAGRRLHRRYRRAPAADPRRVGPRARRGVAR